jgi:sirohydrochlorin cobaltochelatase
MMGVNEFANLGGSRLEIFARNPHQLQGRQLYYGSAVGTDPDIAKLILEQVELFDKTHT